MDSRTLALIDLFLYPAQMISADKVIPRLCSKCRVCNKNRGLPGERTLGILRRASVVFRPLRMLKCAED